MTDFKAFSKNYDIHREADLGLLEIVIGNLKLSKDMHILDFGCGTGNYLCALQKKGYTNLYGLDKEESMQEIAVKKTGLNVRIGTHLNIPFEKDFFDAVTLIAMIHFIDDIDSLFRNLYSISKKYGRISIVTQSHEQVDSRFYNKYFPSLAEMDKQRYHRIENITATAEQNGFTVCDIQEYSSGTDMLVDKNYFNLIKDKSFYVLRLLSDDEFDRGMEKFNSDMVNGNFTAKFAGWTIITVEKNKDGCN